MKCIICKHWQPASNTCYLVQLSDIDCECFTPEERTDYCSYCHGHGSHPDDIFSACPVCGGSGIGGLDIEGLENLLLKGED